jgi:hypothetical protein
VFQHPNPSVVAVAGPVVRPPPAPAQPTMLDQPIVPQEPSLAGQSKVPEKVDSPGVTE